MIRALALYERAEGEVLVTADELKSHAFGPRPSVEIIAAVQGEKVVGAALFYEKYSTWKGPAMHLEDLIVAEELRSQGIGHQLMKALAAIALERGYRRMYWQVLDWNEPAIRFYKRYGTELDGEWYNAWLEKPALTSLTESK